MRYLWFTNEGEKSSMIQYRTQSSFSESSFSTSSVVFPDGSMPASSAFCATSTALVFPPASKSASVFAVDGSPVTSFRLCGILLLIVQQLSPTLAGALLQIAKRRLQVESLSQMVRTSLCPLCILPAASALSINRLSTTRNRR